jgi:hypothetical protein
MVMYPFMKANQNSFRSYSRESPFIPHLGAHIQEFNNQFVAPFDKENVDIPKLLAFGEVSVPPLALPFF